MERSTYAVGWLLVATALIWLGRPLDRTVLRHCGQVIATIGMIYTLGILVLITNPLWTGELVGATLIFNDLLYVFGVPALLCGALAYVGSLGKKETTTFSRVAGGVGIFLTFILVTAQVRQGFVGAVLNAGEASFLEWGTYPIAWMALGILALAIGMALGRTLVRRAGVIFFCGGLLYTMLVPGVVMNPGIHHLYVGGWPVLNHLLYVYGTPPLLAMAMAWLVFPGPHGGLRFFKPAYTQEHNELYALPSLNSLARAGVAVLMTILVTMEVRQFFQHDYLNAPVMTFVERATYPIAWLLLAGFSFLIAQRFLESTARRAGYVLSWAGLIFAVLICAVAFNPLMAHESVGDMKIFNWLLYAYGIPAIGAALLARIFSGSQEPARRALAWMAGLSGLFLVWILVTLEVQHFFRGDHLAFGNGIDGQLIKSGEMAAYSLAWALLGGIWLITGILTKSQLFRWASLVMMLMTIFKVFLFDLTGLSDIQRVLSLAGLGVSLMALAFIYHRFVFAKEPHTPAVA